MHSPRIFWKCAGIASLLGLLVLGALPLAQVTPDAVAASTVSGTVYRDYNANGMREAVEPGIPGIIVTAYDATGAPVASTTTRNGFGIPSAGPVGSYDLNPSVPGPYRIEFSGWPAYLRPGAHGSQSGTSIQFVPDGVNATINVGLQHPSQYCQDNPTLLTACYVNGDPTVNGSTANLPWLVEVPSNPAATSGLNTYRSSGSHIGSTWGIAWQARSRTALVAAVMKRHTGFGPGGPGAIYRVDLTNSARNGTLLVDLNTLGIPGAFAGNDPRTPGDLSATATTPNHDPAAFDAVGKLSLGGIDLSEDERTLWVMNLYARTLLEIRVGVPAATPTAADVTVHTLPDPGCSDGVFRPWAVKVHDGKVYIGGVCSGETPTPPATKNSDRSDLRAYVYVHDPAGPVSTFSPVIDFPLDYPRGYISAQSATQANAGWLPWIDSWSDIGPPPTGWPTPDNGPFGQTMYPQPMLTALEFDNNGAMILGFLDRAGMQLGNNNYSPLASDTQTYEGAVAGDTLRACPNASGVYILESNGSCGGQTSTGANNNQGPGNGEYYVRDSYTNSHQEVTLGGLAMLRTQNQVVVSVYDPLDPGPYRSGGLRWFSNSDGSLVRGYLVFGQDEVTGTGTQGRPATFGKAAGLGDVVAVCNAAPIEIGNRVWRDSNGNGVQDAGEPPIPGVIVRLFAPDGTTELGMAITDANGDYFFSSGPGTNTTAAKYSIAGLTPNTAGYSLRIYPSENTGPLAGLQVTRRDADPTLGGDTRDSDATAAAGPTPVYLITFGTGDPGANDHTYDFGFAPSLSLGNLVWNDSNNNGVVDSGEPGIDGVAVELYPDANADGTPDSPTPLATTTTSGGGLYRFDNLVPGTYVVVLPGSNFATGGPLAGLRSSTGTVGAASGPYEPGVDSNTDIDNDDNGTGSGGQIVSRSITLAAGSEPTTDGDSDPDSNLTLDIGVFWPASLGSIVWDDTNRNGQRDQGEAGVPNVTVTLYDASGNALATTTTDGTGFYTFTNLPPGTYSIGFSGLPPGYSFTQRDVGADTSDSDVDPATGRTVPTTLVPGQNDPTWWAGIYASPTAITVLSFTAERGGAAVVVRWTTGAELNSWGFHLLRSSDGTRANAVQVTLQLVPAAGRGGNGASYRWVDQTAQPGVTYTYWLVEVEQGGTTAEYGPATVAGAAASPMYRYLPLIRQ